MPSSAAAACSNTVRYASACLCWPSVTIGTTTITPAPVTETVTVTSTPEVITTPPISTGIVGTGTGTGTGVVPLPTNGTFVARHALFVRRSGEVYLD